MWRSKVVLRSRFLLVLVGVAVAAGAAVTCWQLRERPDRSEEARRKVGPDLERALHALGSSLGSPAFIRVFKEPATLELWVRSKERFVLFKTYPICRFSGGFGPKTARGGDDAISEIFTVVHQALLSGQEAVSVQALPFPLTADNLKRHETLPHRAYWDTLEPAYRWFERDGVPPRVTVSAGGYQIEPAR